MKKLFLLAGLLIFLGVVMTQAQTVDNKSVQPVKKIEGTATAVSIAPGITVTPEDTKTTGTTSKSYKYKGCGSKKACCAGKDAKACNHAKSGCGSAKTVKTSGTNNHKCSDNCVMHSKTNAKPQKTGTY